MEKESLGFSLEKTISSITWLIQDYSDEIKNWVYVILFASLISSNAFALEEIPRLENTWNIAENLNNPANLTLWKKWSDAHKYSIWYIKTTYNGATRKFLVFCTPQDWLAAMRVSISKRQAKYTDKTIWEFIDLWVTGSWKVNLDNNWWVWWKKARWNYQKTFLKAVTDKFSSTHSVWLTMNSNFSEMNTHVIATALSKAEWFKWGNKKYENSNYCI